MFLEPIYLNENMVLNCASYLFGGVVLNKETMTQRGKEKSTNGSLSAGGKLGIDIFSNLVHANTDLTAQHQSQNNLTTETKVTSNIALGAIHQSVIEDLEIKDFIFDLSDENLNTYSNNNKYVKIKATLVPVDYFAMLQIFQMVIPQLENFFNLFGSSLFGDGIENAESEKKQNIIKSFSLISSLVSQLETTYLESNQLEMLLINEETKSTIGVVDIDISSHNANEIKAKLTDGNFVIIGKVTKFANEGESINLLQRSLLSTIIEKIENVLEFIDERSDGSSESSFSQWLGHKESILPLLNKLFINEVKGKAFRIKAMSVCM